MLLLPNLRNNRLTCLTHPACTITMSSKSLCKILICIEIPDHEQHKFVRYNCSMTMSTLQQTLCRWRELYILRPLDLWVFYHQNGKSTNCVLMKKIYIFNKGFLVPCFSGGKSTNTVLKNIAYFKTGVLVSILT